MEYHDLFEQHFIRVWTRREGAGWVWAYTVDDGPMSESETAADMPESFVLEEGIQVCRRAIKPKTPSTNTPRRYGPISPHKGRP